MPQDESSDRRLIEQWIAKADQDLGVCRLVLESGDTFFEPAAFHAQQAAEKYVKAYLLTRGVRFPKTHDLGQLLDLLLTVNATLAGTLAELDRLNPLAVETRYPSDAPSLTAGQAHRALELAQLAHDQIVPLISVK